MKHFTKIRSFFAGKSVGFSSSHRLEAYAGSIPAPGSIFTAGGKTKFIGYGEKSLSQNQKTKGGDIDGSDYNCNECFHGLFPRLRGADYAGNGGLCTVGRPWWTQRAQVIAPMLAIVKAWFVIAVLIFGSINTAFSSQTIKIVGAFGGAPVNAFLGFYNGCTYVQKLGIASTNGTTYTTLLNLGPGFYFASYEAVSGTNFYFTEPQALGPFAVDSGTYTFTLLPPSGMNVNPPTTWNVYNNSYGPQCYQVVDPALGLGVQPGQNCSPPAELVFDTYDDAGYVVFVPPGTSTTITVHVPSADCSQVSLKQVFWSSSNIITGVLSGPQPMPLNGPGDGNWDSSSVPTGISPGVASSSTSPGSAPPSSPPIIYNATNSYYTTNPPIIYSSGAITNTSLAVEQSGSALSANISQFAQQNHLDLSHLDSDLVGYGSSIIGGLSNVVGAINSQGTGTNAFGFPTNLVTESSFENYTNWTYGVQTNAQEHTNLDLYGLDSITNVALAEANALSNGFVGVGGWIPNSPGSVGGSAGDIVVGTITAGTHSFPIVLSTSAFGSGSALFAALKILLAALVWLECYYLLYVELKEVAWKTLYPGQIGGVQQSFAGFNAALPSAVAYIAIFSGLFIGLITAGSAFILHGTNIGQATAVLTDLTGVTGTWGAAWGWVSYAVPVQDILAAFITYLTVSFFEINALGLGVAFLVKHLPR